MTRFDFCFAKIAVDGWREVRFDGRKKSGRLWSNLEF